MKSTLTLLIASTALTVAIGQPVWSAMRAPADAATAPWFLAIFDNGEKALPLVFVSGDDDDDDDDNRRYRRASREDDDDDDDDDCEGDDDDDDDCRGNARRSAPTGPVAPPSNGLFGTGAPPQVQVN